jgi:peptidoglycan/xylan/chitin deacetylase (PgdA/CDA1 family)
MSQNVVFLMYHELQLTGRRPVDESPGYQRYVVSKEQFEQQLEMVSQRGFKGANVSQSLVVLSSADSAQPTVCFTFDDGCASDLEVAAPLLAKKGFNATFYVTVDHLGKDGYLTKAELRELGDLGFEIGSHSMTHRHLSDLDEQQIRNELLNSKDALEEIVGKPIDHFSCPGGRVNTAVTKAALDAGYKTVATSRLGTNSSQSNRFALARVAVKRDMNLKTFARICNGKGQFLLKSEDSILHTGKRILGNERYDRLRGNILSFLDRHPASSDTK